MTTIFQDGSTWLVKSFTSPDKAYRVSLGEQTCTCPHHQKRGAICKHLRLAASTERFERLAKKARTLPDTALLALLPRYQQKPDIALAIRAELWERQTGARF